MKRLHLRDGSQIPIVNRMGNSSPEGFPEGELPEGFTPPEGFPAGDTE